MELASLHFHSIQLFVQKWPRRLEGPALVGPWRRSPSAGTLGYRVSRLYLERTIMNKRTGQNAEEESI
jgi:hypothetical protein